MNEQQWEVEANAYLAHHKEFINSPRNAELVAAELVRLQSEDADLVLDRVAIDKAVKNLVAQGSMRVLPAAFLPTKATAAAPEPERRFSQDEGTNRPSHLPSAEELDEARKRSEQRHEEESKVARDLFNRIHALIDGSQSSDLPAKVQDVEIPIELADLPEQDQLRFLANPKITAEQMRSFYRRKEARERQLEAAARRQS